MHLNQVTLPCTDVSASIAFYRLLGCELLVQSDHYARFKAPAGDTTLSVHRVDASAKLDAAGPWSGAVVYFECGALDLRVAELQAAGVVFDQLPRDEPWLWREARLRDPAGNPLCLYLAGEARLNPPWRVGGQQPGGLSATRLETPRMQLRELRHEDLAAFFEFNRDPAVTRYLPYGPWQSMQDAVQWFHRMCDLSTKGLLANRVLERTADGSVLGSCLLMNYESGAKVEVGYLLSPAFQGRGYMVEAMAAVIGDAFATLPLRRVEAYIDARNTASQRLVEKLGFVREALLRDAWCDQGVVSDATVYGLLHRDWSSRLNPPD